MYSLCREVFMTNIIDIISEESAYAREQSDREEAYRRKVISAFMEYGRIKSIPAQRKKEHILLEELSLIHIYRIHPCLCLKRYALF